MRDTSWVLAEPTRFGAYHQLSSLGLFIWKLMDGAHNVEEVLASFPAERGPVQPEEVARIMAELPEEQRTAILLKEYHGLTFQEIADMQGCPLSTVKTRLYQGLTVLRRQLERSGVSGGFKNHV